jgi:hypothetical protein
LSGKVPSDWYNNDNILKEFFASFAIPERVPASATEENINHGFKK